MNKQSKNIGLFGGSFNPPHLGHVAVLRHLTTLDSLDAVWILPVFKHPFGKDLAGFDSRVAMLELVLDEVQSPKLKIETIEQDLGLTPSYTFDVVTKLKIRHPDFKFTLILGSDAKNDLPKWHRHDELKNLAHFYFLPRAGFENSPFPKASSTEIRAAVSKRLPLDAMTLKTVADYIYGHGLYKSPS